MSENKNIYYRESFMRVNNVKLFILTFAWHLCSLPRMLIEVFTRKDFGERYFSRFGCIILFVVLCIFPYNQMVYQYGPVNTWEVLRTYSLWYAYLAAFAIFACKRWLEVKRNPSVFDFKRYSLSLGIVNPVFFSFKIMGKVPTLRQVETVIEPLPFFLAGIILILLHQPLGLVLAIAAVLYSLSYFCAYDIGDNIIMNMIDEIICNEETESIIVDGKGPEDTRGARFLSKRPTDEEMRKKVADKIKNGGKGDPPALAY